ncbi:LysR family transcriptional regulator [Shimia biformata]|uniref:LysR family transcriptional regulator n=1 Tax=Shimia biformata TaxID=1294299 RepID=UPI00194ECACB|nr:LysR family transcriptional regulator [Shimia biformata]
MLIKGVTLKGLEVFEALAASGSVAQAAQATGLSQPAVSQQIRNLESALGTALVDHGKRPMSLTPAGRSFLTRAQTALSELRLGQSELAVLDLGHLSTLSMGIIDDFDNDLTPRLATILAETLNGGHLTLLTAPSLGITTALRDRSLHLGVAASSGEVIAGVQETRLVRDPFILVSPRDTAPTDAMSGLPFLRYDADQLISQQIETQLARAGQTFDDHFQIGSHVALMALVANGAGWTITTPLGFMRAGRFHDRVAAHPLPFAPFTRTISLYASADWPEDVPATVATTLRALLREQVIDPARAALPWLGDSLSLIGD